MKPAWDQLGGEYKDSSSVLIGDVDCTQHSDLCQKYGVRGYPTIKYFKDGNTEGESYSGGRDFDALSKFVKENLLKACDVNDESTCTERENKFIGVMKKRGADAVTKQLDRLTKMQGSKMKAELKQWLNARLHILKQMKE